MNAWQWCNAIHAKDLNDDDDVIQLHQDLMSKKNTGFSKLVVRLLPGFTEAGARRLANAMNECNISCVNVSVDQRLPATLAVEIVRILYLQGNRPVIHGLSTWLMHVVDCIRVEEDATGLTGYDFLLCDDRDPVLFGNALQSNTTLRELTFRSYQHRITEEGCFALAKGIRLSRITKIRFGYWTVDKDMEDFLDEVFRHGILESGRLFDLFIECWQAPACIHFDFMPSLASLSISRGTLDAGGWSQSLSAALNLTSVTLRSCRLRDEGLAMLSRGLRENRSVKELNLESNEITNVGLAAFSHSWHADSPLESLNLAWNEIGATGVEQLMKAVVQHPLMKVLVLNHNWSIGLVGLTHIGNQLPNVGLTSLNVTCCYQPRYDLNNHELQKALQPLVGGLQANFAICNFEMWGDLARLMGRRTFRQLMFYVEFNKHGMQLLTYDNANTTLWCHVLAKCSKYHRIWNVFYFLVVKPDLMVSASGIY